MKTVRKKNGLVINSTKIHNLFYDTYSNKGVEGGGGACVLGCGGGDGETVGSGVCCLPPNIILYCTE